MLLFTANKKIGKGPFNNYEDKISGRKGLKNSIFAHAQGIKTVHAGGVKNRQDSAHVVVECPLNISDI